LKVLGWRSTRDVAYDEKRLYPYEVNGQAVKFWIPKGEREFTYYAIVIGKGEFIGDAPSLQGFLVRTSKVFGNKDTVKIE
jgi:hypothetical protein